MRGFEWIVGVVEFVLVALLARFVWGSGTLISLSIALAFATTTMLALFWRRRGAFGKGRERVYVVSMLVAGGFSVIQVVFALLGGSTASAILGACCVLLSAVGVAHATLQKRGGE